jgi:dihydrofolate reductase
MMRKVILSLAVSLDGFIEGPNGEYDWCFTDQDYGLTELFKRIDSIFIGRKSYELFFEKEGTPTEFSGFKEYIFSNTLEQVKEGRTLIKGDIKSEVQKIKNEAGKDIWLFGGAELSSSLLQLGLIDEISLAIHPIILGKGKPLFIDTENRIQLSLLNSKTYSTGLICSSYKVVQ